MCRSWKPLNHETNYYKLFPKESSQLKNGLKLYSRLEWKLLVKDKRKIDVGEATRRIVTAQPDKNLQRPDVGDNVSYDTNFRSKLEERYTRCISMSIYALTVRSHIDRFSPPYSTFVSFVLGRFVSSRQPVSHTRILPTLTLRTTTGIHASFGDDFSLVPERLG